MNRAKESVARALDIAGRGSLLIGIAFLVWAGTLLNDRQNSQEKTTRDLKAAQHQIERLVARIDAQQSEDAVNRVIVADQRCAFSAKSTAGHAATVGEFRAIVELVDRVGVPRDLTRDIRRQANTKARRVDRLKADVQDCRATRNRYFADLTLSERIEYLRRKETKS